MKTLPQGLLTRRKIILIFMLAILLPALVLGYLSLSAFSKRREAVRQLLQSNLWMSGESALRAVEAALLDREKSVLRADNFAALIEPKDPGTPFLLDEEFHILLPKTGSEKPAPSATAEAEPEREFSKVFKRAESYEFSQRDFAKAAQAYRESAAMAPTNREKANALASLGRCLISAGNLNEASRVYGELGKKYGSIRDRAGHYFGMTAAFQVYEIEKRRKQEANGLHYCPT